MRQLLRYIYCGRVTFTDNTAVELMAAAAELMLTELSEHCSEQIAKRLDADTAVAYWVR